MLWTEKKLVYAGLLTSVHAMLISTGDMRACADVRPFSTTQEQLTKLNRKMRRATIAFTAAEREMLRMICLSGIFARPDCYAFLSQSMAVRRGPDWDQSAQLKDLYVRLIGMNDKLMALAKDDLGVALISTPLTT